MPCGNPQLLKLANQNKPRGNNPCTKKLSNGRLPHQHPHLQNRNPTSPQTLPATMTHHCRQPPWQRRTSHDSHHRSANTTTASEPRTTVSHHLRPQLQRASDHHTWRAAPPSSLHHLQCTSSEHHQLATSSHRYEPRTTISRFICTAAVRICTTPETRTTPPRRECATLARAIHAPGRTVPSPSHTVHQIGEEEQSRVAAPATS